MALGVALQVLERVKAAGEYRTSTSNIER